MGSALMVSLQISCDFDRGTFRVLPLTYFQPPISGPRLSAPAPAVRGAMRGWRYTVEIVLFEISNSIRPPGSEMGYLSLSLSLHLSIYLSTHLPTYPPTYLPIYLSIHLSIYLSIYLSVHLRRRQPPGSKMGKKAGKKAESSDEEVEEALYLFVV